MGGSQGGSGSSSPITSPVALTEAARFDLIEAQTWYDQKVPGLGDRFAAAADAMFGRIGAGPRQFPVVYRNVRRAVMRRFPYSLFFVLEPDGTALVIACLHGSRDPSLWQGRA